MLILCQKRPDGSWDKCGLYTVLVNPDSATSHYFRKDKSVTIPIHKNHSNMVKFTRGDTSLGIIIASLAELCSRTQLADHSRPKRPSGTVTDSNGNPLGSQLSSRTQGCEENVDHTALEELGEIFSALDGMLVSSLSLT